MRKIITSILIEVGMVIVGAFIGAGLLWGAFLLPINENNLEKSLEKVNQEGWYPDVLEMVPSYGTYFHSMRPSVGSSHNDWKLLSTSAGEPGFSPLYQAMAAYNQLDGEYSRYWHGYLVWLRPLLLFCDYPEIRFLNFLFQLSLVFILLLLIKSKIGKEYAGLFATEYFLLMPLVVSLFLVFSAGLHIALLGAILLLARKDFFDKGCRIFFLFCWLGMATSFSEELLFSLISWGLPIVWTLLLYGRDSSAGQNVGRVVKTGISWFLGYAGMWVMKWAIAGMVLGRNLFEEGWNQVLFRSGNETELEEAEPFWNRFSAIGINYRHYLYKWYYIILLVWLVVLSVRFLYRKLRADSRIPALGLVALAPEVWYLVLSNHTEEHHFFTYRIFNFGIIAVLAMLMICTEKRERGGEVGGTGSAWEAPALWRRVLLRGGILGGCLLLGIFVTFQMRESQDIHNGEELGTYIELPEDNPTVTMELHPAYSGIKEISFFVNAGDSQGSYVLKLFEDGREVDRQELPMEYFSEEGFRYVYFDVGWTFQKNRQYTMELTVESEGDKGTIYILDSGTAGLEELRNVAIAGEPIDTQIGCWIVYWRRPLNTDFVFFALSWYAVFWAAGLLVCQLYMLRRQARNQKPDRMRE